MFLISSFRSLIPSFQFSDYGFRSSQSTADLLTVVSNKIARAFNRSGATRALAIDISTRLLTGFDLEFQVRYLVLFRLFSVIDGFRWFSIGSVRKNVQLMVEFHKAPLLILHFFCYTLMNFLICYL